MNKDWTLRYLGVRFDLLGIFSLTLIFWWSFMPLGHSCTCGHLTSTPLADAWIIVLPFLPKGKTMGAGWIAVAVALAVALGLFNGKKRPTVPPQVPVSKEEKEVT